MSVNCKEEILNLSRRKVIFMGNTLEQNILQLLLFPIFKVSLLVAKINKCISHYFVAQFLKIAINMIETTRREEKNLPSKQPRQILKECMYSIKKIL